MMVTLYSVLLASDVTRAFASFVIFAMGTHFWNTTVSAAELRYSLAEPMYASHASAVLQGGRKADPLMLAPCSGGRTSTLVLVASVSCRVPRERRAPAT